MGEEEKYSSERCTSAFPSEAIGHRTGLARAVLQPLASLQPGCSGPCNQTVALLSSAVDTQVNYILFENPGGTVAIHLLLGAWCYWTYFILSVA